MALLTQRDAALERAPGAIDVASALRDPATPAQNLRAEPAGFKPALQEGDTVSTRVVVPQASAPSSSTSKGSRESTHLAQPAACDHSYRSFHEAIQKAVISTQVSPHLEAVFACRRDACLAFPAQFLMDEPEESRPLVRALSKRLEASPEVPETARLTLPRGLCEWVQISGVANRTHQRHALESAAIMLRAKDLESYLDVINNPEPVGILAVRAIDSIRDPQCIMGLFDFYVEHKQAQQVLSNEFALTLGDLDSELDHVLDEGFSAVPLVPHRVELFSALIGFARDHRDANSTKRLEELAIESTLSFWERKQICLILFAMPGRDLLQDVRVAMDHCDEQWERNLLCEAGRGAAENRQDLSESEVLSLQDTLEQMKVDLRESEALFGWASNVSILGEDL